MAHRISALTYPTTRSHMTICVCLAWFSLLTTPLQWQCQLSTDTEQEARDIRLSVFFNTVHRFESTDFSGTDCVSHNLYISIYYNKGYDQGLRLRKMLIEIVWLDVSIEIISSN